MKNFILITILMISNSLFASSGCKVNLDFISLMGNKRAGIERLIRKELKKKGYETNRKNFAYPDFALTLSQGSVCTQTEEEVSIFREIFYQVVGGSFTNLQTSASMHLHGFGEARLVGEVLGSGLRLAAKNAISELPDCKNLN
jgi:hypothetical protein